MIRGTTPTHTFNIPFDTATIAKVRITYRESSGVTLTKSNSDCEILPGQIKVKLTQEDTLMFNNKQPIDIQLKVLTLGGEVLVSNTIQTIAGKCLDDEVLK